MVAALVAMLGDFPARSQQKPFPRVAGVVGDGAGARLGGECDEVEPRNDGFGHPFKSIARTESALASGDS
jgi:hypothetical protein